MDGSARNGIKVKGSTAFSSTGKLSNNSQNSNGGAIMTDGTIQTSGEAAAVTAEMKKGLDGYTDFSPEKLGEADTVSGVEKHDDPVCSAIVEGLKASGIWLKRIQPLLSRRITGCVRQTPQLPVT